MQVAAITQMPAQLAQAAQNLHSIQIAQTAIQNVARTAAEIPSFTTVEEFARVLPALPKQLKEALHARVYVAQMDQGRQLLEHISPPSRDWTLDKWEAFFERFEALQVARDPELYQRIEQLESMLDRWDVVPKPTIDKALEMLCEPAKLSGYRGEVAVFAEKLYKNLTYDSATGLTYIQQRRIYDKVANKFLY